MKRYEYKPMNYDENGFYPDEIPKNGSRTSPLDVMIAVLLLLLFAGCITCMVIFGNREGEGYKAIYAFFSLFAGVGLLAVIYDLVKGEKLQVGAFVALAIGAAGVAGTRIVATGGEDMKMKALKLFACGIPLAMACIGAYYASAGIKRALESKDSCTLPVSAVCKSVDTVTTTVNGRGTSMKYCPTYEYTHDGTSYTVKGGITAAMRVQGDLYEVFIDPEKPTLIHDPEAEKESIGGALIHALLIVVLPLAVMALFMYAFYEAGI